MPSKKRLMQASAAAPDFAKKGGTPQKVAREFVAADKRPGRRTKPMRQRK